MNTDHDLAAALHRSVDDVTPSPQLLDNVRAGGQRRMARRRTRAVALTVVTACAIAAGVLIAQPAGRAPVNDREVPTATPTATMPDLIGLGEDAAWARYAALGLDHANIRYVASNDAPPGTVVAQDPPAGEPAPRSGMPGTLTYSAGGPAVPLNDVPSQSADLLRDSLLPDEQVLVVPTDAGTAYKIDAVLVGPCAAVALAYRTFPDPSYDDRCY
jgi:hypothetical protein